MKRSSSFRTRSVALSVEALEERRVLSTASYVTSLYTTLLQRSPAPAEVAYWEGQINDAGVSPAQVATDFTTSAEFRTNLIEADYQHLLGRTPAAPEVSYWLNTLQQGLPEQQMTTLFLASSEYYQNHGNTPTGWVDAVYQDELGRAADPAGEAYWVAGLQQGMPRQAAAAALVSSPEALANVVNAAYVNVLGRAPDPQGLAYWTGSLISGLTPSQLKAVLASSAEFINAQGGLDAPAPAPSPDPPTGNVDNTNTTPTVDISAANNTPVVCDVSTVTVDICTPPVDTSCTDPAPVDCSYTDTTDCSTVDTTTCDPATF
jgi:hypothetical protein